MKNFKEKAKGIISRKVGDVALKVGDYDGGSTILFINDPKMPKELIQDQKSKFN